MNETSCNHECKFQKDGKCRLERADWVRRADGAQCMSHLFDIESRCHHS